MSLGPGETKVQDVSDLPKGPTKCRIPQRLPPARQRPITCKAKPNPEPLRPKSASRTKDDNFGKMQAPRPARPGERCQLKRPSTITRKPQNDNNSQANKGGKNVITVPISGGFQKHRYTRSGALPDQETIKKREELEMVHSGLSEVVQSEGEQEGDPVQLKKNWQQYMTQFDKMKNELDERQKAIVELYASMQNTHSKMSTMGQKLKLPPPEDLKIMNVANLTPDQLLKLCSLRQADSKPGRGGQKSAETPLAIDVKKLYGLPTRIVGTCEQTLFKHKEMIGWFDTLKSEHKGISMQVLERKLNEFSAENEMLKCALEEAKGDIIKDINELVEFMRKSVNETAALQVRLEEQMCKLSELSSQNKDLCKQLHNTESLKCNKSKLEELEKELKDAKCKNNLMKDRLLRAEGQIKIGEERASQLEAALEQARSQGWKLERTVQQLSKQNQKLQSDFDKELSKLTESIRDNTSHLEEIAVAREKLQSEKEDLEKRLEQLSQSYNEALNTVKHDMNVNLAKLIETEKKYQEEAKMKEELVEKLKCVCAQSQEYETRNKELTERLQDIEAQLSKAMNFEKELQSTKHNLELAHSDVEEYKSRMAKQSETIKLLESDLEDSLCLQEKLNINQRNKEEHIAELEKKQAVQQKLLEESESKMSSYEHQLSALKRHITQLQDDFGEFENLEELLEMVNQQRANLLEATKQNGELAQALQNKDLELQHHLESLADQEQLLEQRAGMIKMLSEKEEEQTNIIKLLRTNLEMRTQADMDLSQQISEKNSEIQALIANVETRKQQICQLEKIILTLEDQTRKSSLQRRKDQDKIDALERQISEYKEYTTKPVDFPATNLDSIIKILEDELGSSFEPQTRARTPEYIVPIKKGMGDRRRELQHFECHTGNNNNIQKMFHTEHESIPTKMLMGNFVKTYIANTEEHFRGDNLDRKKAITNIGDKLDRKNILPDNIYAVPLADKDNNYIHTQDFRETQPGNIQFKDKLFLTKNIPLLNSNQFKDEKKCKMFKFAGHRL